MANVDLKPRIGVFDSGIGGTGVLAAVRELAPWADLVYVADRAFGPYGERSLDEVRARTELLARYLASAGVEMIVIACNSASAAALHHLRRAMPNVPFVGMEPAIKPAVELTATGVVGVMATGATFQGELFKDLVGRHGAATRIVEQACPGLALAIETGDDVGSLLDAYLSPMVDAGADVIVLGCTHYPLVIGEIRRRLPDHVALIDPAPAVARRTLDVAREAGVDLDGSGAMWWWTTESPPDVARRTVDGDRVWEAVDLVASAEAAVRIGEASLTALRGDLTSMSVDVITNAANVRLEHGGGVAAAIRQAGGPVIDEESAAWIAEYGHLEPGIAALTSAGAMPSSYVVHVAGPIHTPGRENDELLAAAVLAAIDMAAEIGASSIALPAISAGTHGFPITDATRLIVETTAEYLTDTPSSIRSVRLVGFSEPATKGFANGIDDLDIEP